MEHSENKKTNASINYLPSCEINGFLEGISTQKSLNSKNDVSKGNSCKIIHVSKNPSDLPPSCEMTEIDKDGRK